MCYNVTMELSYLNLGDMLTFIGLVIAIIQLAKPRYKLIWKLSSVGIKIPIILCFSVGYLCPLFSLLMSSDGFILFHIIAIDPGIMQISGFVFITLGVLLLAYTIMSSYHTRRLIKIRPKIELRFLRYHTGIKRIFDLNVSVSFVCSLRSMKKFYRITSEFLLTENIVDYVWVINRNLKRLVRSACRYSPYGREIDSKNVKSADDSCYAFELFLHMLTDDRIMKYICTDDYAFLSNIIYFENKYYINFYDGSKCEFGHELYSNIVRHLLINQDSFAYRQLNINYGSARISNIYELITQNKITSRERILPSLLTYDVAKHDVALEKYAESLAVLFGLILVDYKNKPKKASNLMGDQRLINMHDILNDTMGHFDGVLTRLVTNKRYRQEYADDPVNSTIAKILSAIKIKIIGYAFLDKDPDSFKKCNFEIHSVNDKDAHFPQAFTSLMAEKMYDFIEAVSILNSESKDDFTLREAVYGAVTIVHSKLEIADHYRQLLYERLFDKSFIGDLSIGSNIDGYYPVVLKALMAYLLPFFPSRDETDLIAYNRLIGYMKNELSEAIIGKKKMRDEKLMKDVLLPSSISVRITGRKVHYYHTDRKGKKTEIKLEKKD